MAAVIFKFGNQQAYDELEEYDTNALYFIEDTLRLYKGNVLMSEKTIFTDETPLADESVSDRLYVVTNEDGTVDMYVKKDDEMVKTTAGVEKLLEWQELDNE